MRYLILFIMIFSSSSAIAQFSEPMQRAAYCAGVLKSGIAHAKSGASVPLSVCEKYDGFASREACAAHLQAEAVIDLERKLKRYDDYLRSEIAKSALIYGGDVVKLAMSRALIEKKGAVDRETMDSTRLGERFGACMPRCSSAFDQCFIDCVAETHPTEASVLRCAVLPDQLPY